MFRTRVTTLHQRCPTMAWAARSPSGLSLPPSRTSRSSPGPLASATCFTPISEPPQTSCDQPRAVLGSGPAAPAPLPSGPSTHPPPGLPQRQGLVPPGDFFLTKVPDIDMSLNNTNVSNTLKKCRAVSQRQHLTLNLVSLGKTWCVS